MDHAQWQMMMGQTHDMVIGYLSDLWLKKTP